MFFKFRYLNPAQPFEDPRAARGWLSRVLPALPAVIFNRGEDKRTLSTPSNFAVYSHGGALFVTAIGQEAVTFLVRYLPELQVACLAQCPSAEIQTECGVVGLGLSNRLQDFRVHHLVVENNAARSRVFTDHKAGDGSVDLLALSERVFRDALERRALWLGIEMPEDAIFGGCEIVKDSPVYAGGKLLMSVDLAFRTNVQFHGPWHVGRLANKGCGGITSMRRANAAPVAAAEEAFA